MTRESDDVDGGGLDDAVKAMGHPGRRAMLRLTHDGERAATESAEASGLSPSAASPHLKMLRDVGLMHVRVDAKRRLYSVDFERLAQVRAVFDELWTDRLDAFEAERRVRCGNASAPGFGMKLVDKTISIAACAEGRDPGPDPLAAGRGPARAELGVA